MKKYIYNNLITFKFPARIFAIQCIFILGLITAAITYKSTIEALAFFNFEGLMMINAFVAIIAMLIALATVVQSAPLIWDRLSYWGQAIDNLILYFIKGKKFFLSEVEELLKEDRKLINDANRILQNISWELMTKVKKYDARDLKIKLADITQNNIKKSNDIHSKIIKLLKNNDICDNLNIARKYEADLNLNLLIVQLAETCDRMTFLTKTLAKST